MGLGLKNQFILVKTIKFSVLVPQKSSVESSINNEKTTKRRKDEKSTFNVSALLNLRYLRLLSTLLKCKQLIEIFWNDFSWSTKKNYSYILLLHHNCGNIIYFWTHLFSSSQVTTNHNQWSTKWRVPCSFNLIQSYLCKKSRVCKNRNSVKNGKNHLKILTLLPSKRGGKFKMKYTHIYNFEISRFA